MNLTKILTFMVHLRLSIESSPLPRPCPHPPQNKRPTPEVEVFEDLIPTSQHTTPPLLTTISIISGYKHQKHTTEKWMDLFIFDKMWEYGYYFVNISSPTLFIDYGKWSTHSNLSCTSLYDIKHLVCRWLLFQSLKFYSLPIYLWKH